jgi:endophilin-B
MLTKPSHSFQAHHLKCLNEFIDAQMNYYAQCQQYMVDLQKQLGR